MAFFAPKQNHIFDDNPEQQWSNYQIAYAYEQRHVLVEPNSRDVRMIWDFPPQRDYNGYPAYKLLKDEVFGRAQSITAGGLRYFIHSMEIWLKKVAEAEGCVWEGPPPLSWWIIPSKPSMVGPPREVEDEDEGRTIKDENTEQPSNEAQESDNDYEHDVIVISDG